MLATAAQDEPLSTNRRIQAYEQIRRRILDAELVPGAPLSEYQLAATLGLSRTPVREALKRLDQEGLVRSIPQRGAFVAELTLQDILEIYQVREQLESFAARVAAERMEIPEADKLRAELDEAREAAQRGQMEGAFSADTHLHKEIIETTRNRRLASILATLDDQVHRIRYLSPRATGRLEATLTEHAAIVDAIRARDAEAAEEAMRRHLQLARDNAVRVIAPLGLTTPS